MRGIYLEPAYIFETLSRAYAYNTSKIILELKNVSLICGCGIITLGLFWEEKYSGLFSKNAHFKSYDFFQVANRRIFSTLKKSSTQNQKLS